MSVIPGTAKPTNGASVYVPVGAEKFLPMLIITNAYGAIILFVRVTNALSSVMEETNQFTAIRGCVELAPGNGLPKGKGPKIHLKRSENTNCFKKD